MNPDDPLGKLVDSSTGGIRLQVLREGKTDDSLMGAVRKQWREALDVDDEELFMILGHLSIKPRFETLEDARRNLNMGLSGAGLRQISDCTVTDPYSQLIWKLHKEGKHWFCPDDLLSRCQGEGLYVGTNGRTESTRPRVLGVRSFIAKSFFGFHTRSIRSGIN